MNENTTQDLLRFMAADLTYLTRAVKQEDAAQIAKIAKSISDMALEVANRVEGN